MADGTHPAAMDALPSFVTPPGETDFLYLGLGIFLVVTLLLTGVLYFRLHALPESMAHRSDSAQLQLVGVLALLALFTHNDIFWVAALLLAALRMPDISSPLSSIAESLGMLATRRREEDAPPAATPPQAPAESTPPAPATPTREA